ncbi:MAG: META domain-containing protein [Chromatiales bacterium]|nr:META domain-containing protein [Chromatiales bacterium]
MPKVAESSDNAVPLTGTYWRLVELAGAKEIKPGPRREPHLILGTGDFKGSSGCNRLFGPVTVDGETVKFGPIAATKMACPDDGGQERRFFEALEGAEAVEIEGTALSLLNAGRVLARFQAQDQPAASE